MGKPTEDLGLAMPLKALIPPPLYHISPLNKFSDCSVCKERSVEICILLSLFKKYVLKQILFLPLNVGAPSSLLRFGGLWSFPGEASAAEPGWPRGLSGPSSLNSLSSVEFGSPLFEAITTTTSLSFFLGRYIYPLDSSTWIEYWPTDTTCPSCSAFLANLDEFAEDIFLNGCENPWRGSTVHSFHCGLLLLECLPFLSFFFYSQLVLFGKLALLRISGTCFY